MSSHNSLFHCILLSLILIVKAQKDLTLVPNSTDSDVGIAVTRKIYRSGIFEDDFFLGHRVALVSSQFGKVPLLPISTHRGIWQLSREQLEETKTNPDLTLLRNQVAEHWQTEIGQWDLVTWEQLDIPLISGVAFQLFVNTLTESSADTPFLPSLLIDQAQFYQQHINPLVNASYFIATVSVFESAQLSRCNSDADIVLIHDASCSVYPLNFTDTLTYFANILGFFHFDQIRVGHVVYSNDVVINFGLDNEFATEEELIEALMNAARPESRYTQTGAAISAGFEMFSSVTRREGVTQILVSYTDGFSIDLLDDVTNKTLSAGIETFVVATAFSWINSQLWAVAHNKPGRVLKHGYTYSLSPELLYRSNLEFCSVPTRSSLGFLISAAVDAGEKRYFHYEVPMNATFLSVSLMLEEGSIRGLYSWIEETPDWVVNDGELIVGLGGRNDHFLSITQNDQINLFVGIMGFSPRNNFTIVVNVVEPFSNQ